LTGSNADYGATFNLKQTIDASGATTATGSYDSYASQLEFTPPTTIAAETALYRGALSSSTQEPTAEYVTYPDAAIDYQPGEPAAVFEVFAHQHEDWYIARLISQSSRPPHPASIVAIDNVVSGSYSTYKSVLPTDALQSISGSFNVFYGGVVSDPLQIITVDTLHLLCHDMRALDWREFRDMSNSIASGSTPPMDRTRIDLGLSQLNKIKYDDVNKGSEGAEPYNRVYARKLFDYEIEATRAGGVTSLYIPALYVIPPSSDFTELGAYTYFNSPTGIYYYPKIAYQAKPGVPLNHPWNGTTFVGAGTWSYGSSYNKNDVTYQYVTKTDVILGAATQSARLGNGNFYRFTTQVDYAQPADGTAWYSGSVPTFNPPSLDTNNWTKIKFQPFELREARREVFDTFTIPDPALNNFNTTTINVNKIIDVPDRYVDINSLGIINSGSFIQGSILAQNVSALFAIQASVGSLRVRLYRTLITAQADFSRDILTLPSENSGVLLDAEISSAGVVQMVNPIVTLVADSSPPLGKLFYTINNLAPTAQPDVTLLLYYFALQIEPRVPSGYLRKHYRFFRDNSTATKRRNYLGCKNTVDTTVDGLPPVQIFIGEGTTFVVSPTLTNAEITTGGGGTLNVT